MHGSATFADVDSDQDLDVFVTGFDGSDKRSILYRNITSCKSAPIADADTLSVLTGECSIVKPIVPTATDDCERLIVGTPNVAFPITNTSINQIVWTYTNSRGKSITQAQAVFLSGFSADLTTKGDSLLASPAEATYRWLGCDDGKYTIRGTNQPVVQSQCFRELRGGSN